MTRRNPEKKINIDFDSDLVVARDTADEDINNGEKKSSVVKSKKASTFKKEVKDITTEDIKQELLKTAYSILNKYNNNLNNSPELVHLALSIYLSVKEEELEEKNMLIENMLIDNIDDECKKEEEKENE